MWEFLREINERGTTIILTTHYLEEAENLCRNVAIIDSGRIIESDRMCNVLRKLQTETFVLNLREPIDEAPNLPGFGVALVDDRTLEVEVSKDQSLNDIFARLAAQGIDVVCMRNKVNRLEELFMRLVARRRRGHGRAADERAPESAAAIARAHRLDRLSAPSCIREFSRIVRIWGQTLVPPGVTATLYFIIFGSLIGARIGQMGGYDYMQYIAPGLIMMSVITNSYGNVVSSLLRREIRQARRGTAGLAAAELADRRRLTSWAAWSAGSWSGSWSRSSRCSSRSSRSRICCRPWSRCSSRPSCSPSAASSTRVFAKNFDQISWFPTFVLAPLTYLGGVFYSVSMLPPWARAVSQANPILYMVNAFRYGFLGVADVDVRLAFVIMISFAVGMFALAVALMDRGSGIRD